MPTLELRLRPRYVTACCALAVGLALGCSGSSDDGADPASSAGSAEAVGGAGGETAIAADGGGMTRGGSSGSANTGGGTSGNGGRGGVGGATSAGGSSANAGGSGGSSAGNAGGSGGSSQGNGGTNCGGIAIPRGSGAPSGGTPDQWQNVTPQGISLNGSDYNGDNFGAQDVLVDPARPSDFYAFFCHQGVYKSTDYGQTWTKVNTGANGARIDAGKPWGEGIDSNRCRDPNTPPTLYSAGSQGQFWKSTDGGVNWKGIDLPHDGKAREQDDYDVDVDPYDGKHLIVGFHEESGLAESNDAGETWTSVKLDAGMNAGTSCYPFFIDTGESAGTRKTWIMISQAGGVGTWRTADGGSSWHQVSKNEHTHGGSQIFQAAGAVYMAGVYAVEGWGVFRSTDFGATWMHLGANDNQSIVFGTPKHVYVMSAPFGDEHTAERSDAAGTTWATWSLDIADGPKRAAVSYDGSHNIIVTGSWRAGVLRYVEP